jgi:uncharacterized RDD family membrane protein YckC
MNEQSLDTRGKNTAGFFSRMLALIIDLFLIAFLGLITGAVFLLFISFFDVGQILLFWQNLLGLDNLGRQLAAMVSPIITLLIFSYFVFFWTFLGYTPGKALMGLRIVRQDGRPLSFWRAWLRFIGYSISAFFLFLGFFWILIDRDHEGWHDKIANTHVIYTPR